MGGKGKIGFDLGDAVGVVAPLSAEQVNAARLFACAKAESVEDARMLLEALGLVPLQVLVEEQVGA